MHVLVYCDYRYSWTYSSCTLTPPESRATMVRLAILLHPCTQWPLQHTWHTCSLHFFLCNYKYMYMHVTLYRIAKCDAVSARTYCFRVALAALSFASFIFSVWRWPCGRKKHKKVCNTYYPQLHSHAQNHTPSGRGCGGIPTWSSLERRGPVYIV